jgi:hypothetical protein
VGGFKEGGKSRDNVIYMTSRVEWYGSVADMLGSDDAMAQPLVNLRDHLLQLIIKLYEELIIYQAKCVCYFDRNPFSAFVRDTLKLEGWDGALTAVKEAEDRLQGRMSKYHEGATLSRLKKIEETAARQEKLLREQLDRIAVAVEKNLRIQEQISAKQTESISNQKQWRQEDMNNRQTEKEKDREKRINQMISRFKLPGLDYLRFMNANPDKADNTCQWFLEDPRYREWCAANAGILLLAAIPGQGKSVLAKSLVLKLRAAGMPVCYFFFKKNGGEMQKTAANAFCAFLSQIFEYDKELVLKVEQQIDQGGGSLTTSTYSL